VLLTWSAAWPLAAETLTAISVRDNKVVKRWALEGDPRGLALGADGTIYVGLSQPQSVVAIDAKTGVVKQRLVLDSAEIASTKELVTLRTNPARTRLYIANGSDESATILALPDLGIVREVTIEGEPIRDALPDPKGRYVYLVGRRVHVYVAEAHNELRTIPNEVPMAFAVSANGTTLAVVATEDFGNTKATSVALFETTNFRELARDPLQTDKPMSAALFAASDRALVALGRDGLYEKPLNPAAARGMEAGANGQMRMRIDFGDLVNTDRICLPEGAGPQIAALASNDLLLFAERRCSSSGTFVGSSRRVTPASLYGVDAYAIAYDASNNTLAVTDRAGYLTIYKVPRVALAR
jgi:DNA-binding beta-propeller fold protein YncE